MTGKTLYDKLWESHLVREEPDGTCLLYIDRHLVHEVTSAHAFESLRAGHLMYQVAVDIEQTGAIGFLAHQVRFPQLIVKRFAGHDGSFSKFSKKSLQFVGSIYGFPYRNN